MRIKWKAVRSQELEKVVITIILMIIGVVCAVCFISAAMADIYTSEPPAALTLEKNGNGKAKNSNKKKKTGNTNKSGKPSPSPGGSSGPTPGTSPTSSPGTPTPASTQTSNSNQNSNRQQQTSPQSTQSPTVCEEVTLGPIRQALASVTPSSNPNANSNTAAVPPAAKGAAKSAKSTGKGASRVANDNGADTSNPPPSQPTDPTSALAASLGQGAGVQVTAIAPNTLLVCGPPATVDVVKRAALDVTGGRIEQHAHQVHVVRLFFYRPASDIADAINGSDGLTAQVQAIGTDLLVFPSESDADDRAIEEFRRWISMIDVPRPEVSMLAWSVQVSSPDKQTIADQSTRIRTVISEFNDRLQAALNRAWSLLEWKRKGHDGSTLFAPQFENYVTGQYGGPQPVGAPFTCSEDQYCLGYSHIFKPIKPSLGSMLLALIAAQPQKDGNVTLLNQFVNRLEDLCPTMSEDDWQANYVTQALDPTKPKESKLNLLFPQTYGGCERRDAEFWAHTDEAKRTPGFECLREQLGRSLSPSTENKPGHLGEVRRGLADFLFQYKFSNYYPGSFSPWYQSDTAQTLDASIDPLIVAFNRDVAVYLHFVEDTIESAADKSKKLSFKSDGIVTLQTISGVQSSVNTTTQSFFPSPPTISVSNILSQLATNESNIPPLLSANLSSHAAALIMAAAQAEQRTIAQVGRNLNLQVTAHSLSGASSCEVDVSLTSGESDTPPSLINTTTPGSPTTDNLNRVAEHDVQTTVRVDSQKLFEVSSFGSALVHGREVPLIPPFIDLPYIGNLAHLRLPPGTVYHRSFAIISAVVLPTAADLANVIAFDTDQVEVNSPPPQLIFQVVSVGPQAPTPSVDPAKPVAPGASPGSIPSASTRGVYYCAIARYHARNKQGASVAVSDPIFVPNAPTNMDPAHGVFLKWTVPDDADSVDLLRATDWNTLVQCKSSGCSKPCLVGNFPWSGESAFFDNVSDTKLKPVPELGKRHQEPRRMTYPPSHMVDSHRDMLECIVDEADGGGCKLKTASDSDNDKAGKADITKKQ